jgi:DNA polymerase-3 subunit alpha
LVSEGNTFCVFQLGTSGGTIDLCRRIKPKSINDISYVNSLARPSARDMRNDFIQTKDGKKPFSLLHPTLGRAFNNTFGFGLYEESLMYLAQDVAGWSLHSADRLRKLTKEKGKNPKKAAEWRAEFIRDAVENDVSEAISQRIWDEVVDKFQGYGFNMSHSILYSMTSYKTAYLKAHYPVEFLLANLMAEVKSNNPDARGNIEKIKKELRKNKVKIVKPDINKSQLVYTIEDDNHLITGLDAIKFVGEDAIKDIISKRPFKDFFDFMARVSSKAVRANSIQA